MHRKSQLIYITDAKMVAWKIASFHIKAEERSGFMNKQSEARERKAIRNQQVQAPPSQVRKRPELGGGLAAGHIVSGRSRVKSYSTHITPNRAINSKVAFESYQVLQSTLTR